MTEGHERLRERVAVITGASSGIGEATARRLANEGMRLAIGARRKDRLDELASELADDGAEVLALEMDVTDWDSVQRFAKDVEGTLGGCDLLFVNAGTGAGGNVVELDNAAWHRVLDTNLTGAFYTCKALVPLMTGRDGWKTLIMTASVSGTMGMAGSSAYCASKWGLRGFAQSLALELAPDQVRVTTINPGFVNTRWHEGHPRADDMVQPDDIAQVVVDLATLPRTALIDDLTVWPARMYSD